MIRSNIHGGFKIGLLAAIVAAWVFMSGAASAQIVYTTPTVVGYTPQPAGLLGLRTTMRPVFANTAVATVPVTTSYTPVSTFYTPATTSMVTVNRPVITSSPVITTSRPVVTSHSVASPVTTYYTPSVSAPVTTYYAPSVSTPVTTYYAPSVSTPVTTYYAPLPTVALPTAASVPRRVGMPIIGH